MAIDKCTRSNCHEICISHLDWSIDVDFPKQILHASAVYAFTLLAEKVTELVLDTNHLRIHKVLDADTHKPLVYRILPSIPDKSHLGCPLVIQLEPTTSRVQVDYQTTDQSSALQWLPPEQTAGKVHPYLYTQCQAIHARTLIPCQDVTHVKFTYTATVTTPLWATAVLSGLHQSTETNDSSKTAVWKQPVPISSYLLALAVAQLECRELSHRCAVYSEPLVVGAAAFEFAETEDFLQAAERIAGLPYPWTRYDLLCLPPSVRLFSADAFFVDTLTPVLL